ncbi:MULTISPECIES: YdcF family protein [Nitratireductor]|uniref:YdcF family protein n=1 Tax=Nitratireductor TaxID=245876 RepID=UPI000D0DEB97|nr:MULTISPECIES: YdcF family protein [Nitratireductor]PSM19809.1 YdcF family protein [Nitratireductor sp. StC3]
MFYVVSKIFWALANPLSLAVLLLIAGLIAALAGWRRSAGTATAAAAMILLLGGWTTTGALVLQPLEDRFQRPGALPDTVTGIVVLGGGFEGGVNRVRGGYELNRGGDRFVETAILARRLPEAKILISGGSGALRLKGEGDADTAPRLLQALGVDPQRLILENQSRNTYENAQFSLRLADPQPGERWLLVTSAFHMPRAMGLFRQAGFAVIPWPVDYRTSGLETPGLAQDNPIDSLHNMVIAVREWIGLAAYRLAGWTDALLPAPRQDEMAERG